MMPFSNRDNRQLVNNSFAKFLTNFTQIHIPENQIHNILSKISESILAKLIIKKLFDIKFAGLKGHVLPYGDH